MENKLNKYKQVYDIIQRAYTNKKKNCKHDFELSGCRGYMREIDVYRCKLCGKEIEK